MCDEPPQPLAASAANTAAVATPTGGPHGDRLIALIVVLWRAGLRIQEALALIETDLDKRRGSILVRHGKNDRRRQVGMDAWGSSAIQPWVADRIELPIGPLFCVIDGPTRRRAWSASAARIELHQVARNAGVRRRFAPHQYADIRVMPTWGHETNQYGCGDRKKLGITRALMATVR